MTAYRKAARLAPKRQRTITQFIILASVLFAITFPNFAFADGPEETPEPTPAVVTMDMLPTPTPSPAPKREITYREYVWSDSMVDAVASVYWAEFNNDAEKLAGTQLMANRAAYGLPFADSIEAVALQGHEFNRGRISDRNRELARVNLNKMQTQADGDYAGIDVPLSAVYMKRDGRTLVMMDDQWNEVWRSN